MKKANLNSGNKVLGVIPARGGSKSIINKNIADLNRKPLIEYTIQHANKSLLLDSFIVSTDSVKIANIAKKSGAQVPFIRPKKLSNDKAESIDVVIHALKFMENKKSTKYNYVVLLQPTNPFRSSCMIDKAIKIIKKSKFDSVVSVVDVGANHPHRMYKLGKKNKIIPFVKNLKNPMMPRQKLPLVYIRSGDIYVTTRECLINKKSLIGDNSFGLVVESNSTINIDDAFDLELAKLKIKKKF